MPSKRTKFRRFTIIGGGLLLLLVVVAILDKNGPALDQDDLAGSMAASSAARVELRNLSGEWETDGSIVTDLGDFASDFDLSFTAINPTGAPRTEEFRVFFSRDEEFDSTGDCLVDGKTVRLEAGSEVSVSFTTDRRLVNCLDAGTWYVAVQAMSSDTWNVLPETYQMAGGEAELSLKAVNRGFGHKGTIDLELKVNRPSTAFGAQGLHNHGVDVWLKRGDELCFIAAPPLTVARDPVRRDRELWRTTTASLSVNSENARRIDTSGRFIDPFDRGESLARPDCADCDRPKELGPCDLQEGVWDIAVGPARSEFFEVGKIFAHAPATTLDPTKIEISLTEGQVITVERRGVNPSNQPVRWSVAQEGGGEHWLIGRESQVLGRSGPATIELTISAGRLQPGFYTGAFLFRANDFYGTEVRIPVELVVERSRLGRFQSENESGPIVEGFALQNYPNPFAGRTTIRINVPESGAVRIAVYDLAGREVRVITDQWLTAGPYEVPFVASDLPSGTYLYRVTSRGGSESKTMTLVN